MRTKLLVPLVLAASLYASPASATVVTYELSGTVTQTDAVLPNYMPGIDVNDPLSLFITFEDSLVFQDPFIIGFNTSHYELFVGDFRIYGTNSRAPDLQSLTWYGYLGSVPLIEGPLVNSSIHVDVVSLFNGGLTFYAHEYNACPPFQSCDDTPGFLATIDTVTPVPDAGSTALLLVVGIGALHIARRRAIHRPANLAG